MKPIGLPPTVHGNGQTPAVRGGDHYPGYPPAASYGVSYGGLASTFHRHRWLIVVSVLLSIALALAWNLWTVPTYEATATLRFDEERLNLTRMVEPLSTENQIGTELLALQHRSASVAVIDSLGLRAEVKSPRGARIDEVFSNLQVPAAADSGTIVIRRQQDGEVFVSRVGSRQPEISARESEAVSIGGVTFQVSATPWESDEVRLRIISMDQAVREFDSNREVGLPARDADMIDIKVRHSDPVRAAAAANLLAESMILGRQQSQVNRAGTAMDFLREQLDTLGQQLSQSEDDLRDYREASGVVDMSESARTQVGRLSQIQADRGALEAERQGLANLLEGGRDESDSMARRLISFPTLLRNQTSSDLLGALAQLENERAALATRRTPEDPDIQVLSARIVELDQQLRRIAQTYLQGLTFQIASLDQVVGGFERELNALPEANVHLVRLEREVQVQSGVFTLIQSRLREAEVTQALENPTVHIANAAVVADKPVSPRMPISLAMGAVFGIALGMMTAVGRDLTDRTVRSRADASAISGVPVLGVIPGSGHRRNRVLSSMRPQSERGIPVFAEEGKLFPPLRSSSERNGSVSADELLVSHPNARVDLVESFNQLHASLALSRPDQEIRVVVVTSPLPSEGKTLTTANLALTLAGRGERVLLIDGDLRCGHLHEIFPGPRSPGFAELLAGSASLNEVARPIRVPGTGELMVISAGAVVASPGRLLSLDRLRKIIDATSQPFDYVLIDSPPINLLADASLLGAAADAVLLVIRAGRSRMDEVGYAIDQLAVAHAPLIGTLLTDVDPANNGYDDDAYRYLAGASEYVASHRPVIEG